MGQNALRRRPRAICPTLWPPPATAPRRQLRALGKRMRDVERLRRAHLDCMEVTLGYIVEGSTGYHALQVFKDLPQGAVLLTFDLARRLGVSQGAIHQLLANAVKLRLIKKIRHRGNGQVGWTIGAGNVSVTIEPRRIPPAPPTAEVLERRRQSAERRRRAAESAPPPPKFQLDTPWPPGFVSKFDSPEIRAHEVSPGWRVHFLRIAAARAGQATEPSAELGDGQWDFSRLAGAQRQLLSPPAAVRRQLACAAEALWRPDAVTPWRAPRGGSRPMVEARVRSDREDLVKAAQV
jgi:hypothetical protein